MPSRLGKSPVESVICCGAAAAAVAIERRELASQYVEIVPDLVAVGDKIQNQRHDPDQFPEAFVAAEMPPVRRKKKKCPFESESVCNFVVRSAPVFSDGALPVRLRRYAHLGAVNVLCIL